MIAVRASDQVRRILVPVTAFVLITCYLSSLSVGKLSVINILTEESSLAIRQVQIDLTRSLAITDAETRDAQVLSLVKAYEDEDPGTSIVAACMNRHASLNKTLPSWLALVNISEVVIVDWSSTPPLVESIDFLSAAEQRVRVIRVENETSWVLSRAYNLAILSATRRQIIRMDCDYKVEREFLGVHDLSIQENAHRSAQNRVFYGGNFTLARDENEVHLNGAMLLWRSDFQSVGGYDERIQTYGWEDEDLFYRLERSGLRRESINYDYIAHVGHDDSSRLQHKVGFPQVEIDLNRLLLSHLEAWSPLMAFSTNVLTAATSWAIVARSQPPRSKLSGSGYVKVWAVTQPASLRHLSTVANFGNSWNMALSRRLNNDFKIPWDILTGMNASVKHRLLVKLNVARKLRRDKSPRVLFAHVQHGLGNRLRALGSSMSFAKTTNRTLVLVWETDEHMDASFGDLFVDDAYIVMSEFRPTWPFAEHEKYDSSWADIVSFNYIERDGAGAVKDALIVDKPEKHFYFKSSCIMNSSISLTSWTLDNVMLRSLEPSPSISSFVHMYSDYTNLASRIGIHIRDRGLRQDIRNINFRAEYGGQASSTMDYWRRKSTYKAFVAEMDNLILREPSVSFYVAADRKEIIRFLKSKYLGRIASVERECDDRSSSCIKFALIDILCLAKTRGLYGSNWSSFTEAVERLSGMKANLAGIDFGNTSSNTIPKTQ
jgi:hypothetical protein